MPSFILTGPASSKDLSSQADEAQIDFLASLSSHTTFSAHMTKSFSTNMCRGNYFRDVILLKKCACKHQTLQSWFLYYYGSLWLCAMSGAAKNHPAFVEAFWGSRERFLDYFDLEMKCCLVCLVYYLAGSIWFYLTSFASLISNISLDHNGRVQVFIVYIPLIPTDSLKTVETVKTSFCHKTKLNVITISRNWTVLRALQRNKKSAMGSLSRSVSVTGRESNFYLFNRILNHFEWVGFKFCWILLLRQFFAGQCQSVSARPVSAPQSLQPHIRPETRFAIILTGDW